MSLLDAISEVARELKTYETKAELEAQHIQTNLDELEKLARAATPGPWVAEGPFVRAPADDEPRLRTMLEIDGPGRDDATAGFIAAANPQVVLWLIEMVRDQEVRLNDWREWISARNAEELRGMR